MSAIALASVASAADPSLVGWWKFDETSGATVADSSGGGNNGTVIGNPQWVSGQINGALQLDGVSTYVDLPIGTVMSGLQNGTIAMWVNWAGVGPWSRIIDWGTGTTTYIYVTPSDGSARFHTAITVNSTWTDVVAPNQFPSGDWHHMAITLGGEGAKTLQMWVDGVMVVSATSQWLLSELGRTTQNYVGRSEYSADPYLTASVDDLRIYSRILSDVDVQTVMLGESYAATRPNPKDGTKDVVRDATLTWVPGPLAKTHDVYVGTVFDDVNAATRTDPRGVLASQGQDADVCDPAGLFAFGQTYFWRVDEVSADGVELFKSKVWSFTAETYGFAVKPAKATASSNSTVLSAPDKTIDGSGLDASDQHGTSSSTMWMSKKGQSPIWIKYDFDQPYSLYQMWVWNSNQAIEPDTGFGIKEATIETSLDGATWTALAGVPEFNQATGDASYTHSTVVDFGGVVAKYVRLNVVSNWGATSKQASLSEVRFFYIPVKAFSPTPANAATGVAVDSALNWRSGRQAARHDVMLSADAASVAAGTAVVKSVTDHRCPLQAFGAEYGRAYTWKVTEVNDAAAVKQWEGDLWTFTTPDYGVVDDFESYNDKCNRIFFAWVDGFGHNGSADCGVAQSAGNGSGSTVGNVNPPFAERSIIHGGVQAMPLAYDNTSGKSTSEATRTFAATQDWTVGGAKTLVLFFRGDPANGPGQVYAKINNATVVYAGQADAIKQPVWKQWNIDLASSGTDLKAVKSLTVGVSGSGKGMLLVDDIRLYRAAPAVVEAKDPGISGLSAWYALDGDAKDSSGKGYGATLEGNPVFVDDPGYGKAVQFDGIDDHVVLPIGPLMNTMTSATFATRVYFSNTGGSWQRIFDFGGPNPASGDPTNYMFLTPRMVTNGAMRFAITNAGSAAESQASTLATLPSGWHHVAVVIDGAAMTLQLYLDGDVVAAGTTTRVPKDLGNTNQNWLGRSQFSADGYFTGALDEFRIYNRALTVGEVRYLAGDR